MEKVHMGKVLLMQDLGVQSKFLKTPLSEVDFTDIIKEAQKSDPEMCEDDSNRDMKRKQKSPPSGSSRKRTPQEDSDTEINEMDGNILSRPDGKRIKTPQPPSSSRILQENSDTEDAAIDSMDTDSSNKMYEERKIKTIKKPPSSRKRILQERKTWSKNERSELKRYFGTHYSRMTPSQQRSASRW
ncbi:MAG: hypothetical protein GY705_26945 [Bacteroidetes bacterium]|nr:hypothetical protein [Bacteroidota bacterium]